MGVQFIWSPLYSVGNPEIDAQHKRLFELANALPEKLNEACVKTAIMELFSYTRTHFAAEEQMMLETGYPRYDQHKRFHDELIDRLNMISAKSFDNEPALIGFRQFVIDWIIQHVMQQDKDYARVVQQA